MQWYCVVYTKYTPGIINQSQSLSTFEISRDCGVIVFSRISRQKLQQATLLWFMLLLA